MGFADRIGKIEQSVRQYRSADAGVKKARSKNPVDKFTGIDELILLQTQELREIKNLLGIIARKQDEIPLSSKNGERQLIVPQPKSLDLIAERLGLLIEGQKQNSNGEPARYFTYPADGTKKTVGAGRTIIDFYDGVAKFPDGSEDKISDSLRRLGLEPGSIRSFAVFSNQQAKYGMDGGGLKPIDASDFQTERNQAFSTLRLETTTDTQITLWASTDPNAFFGKLGATTTGGLINSYGVQIDPMSEYGTPVCGLDYYNSNSTAYVTLLSKTVTAGKYGVLGEVSLTPDPKALFQLTIGGVVQFSDKKIVNPLTIKFPDNKLPAATTILIEVKSVDGTVISVNGEISLKEVVAT